MSRANEVPNAYYYSMEDMQQMEKINDSLRQLAPMLPAPEDYDESQQSVMKPSVEKSNKK